MKATFINILSVGVGGCLGAVVRYFFNISLIHDTYPIATILENIIGSFLLGLFTGLSLKIIKRGWFKLALGTGFCGGFTTMSTFAADTYMLFVNSAYTEAMFNIAGTLFGSLVAVHIGLLLGMIVSNQDEVMKS